MVKFADSLGLPYGASLPTVSGSVHPTIKFADSLGLAQQDWRTKRGCGRARERERERDGRLEGPEAAGGSLYVKFAHTTGDITKAYTKTTTQENPKTTIKPPGFRLGSE